MSHNPRTPGDKDDDEKQPGRSPPARKPGAMASNDGDQILKGGGLQFAAAGDSKPGAVAVSDASKGDQNGRDIKEREKLRDEGLQFAPAEAQEAHGDDTKPGAVALSDSPNSNKKNNKGKKKIGKSKDEGLQLASLVAPPSSTHRDHANVNIVDEKYKSAGLEFAAAVQPKPEAMLSNKDSYSKKAVMNNHKGSKGNDSKFGQYEAENPSHAYDGKKKTAGNETHKINEDIQYDMASSDEESASEAPGAVAVDGFGASNRVGVDDLVDHVPAPAPMVELMEERAPEDTPEDTPEEGRAGNLAVAIPIDENDDVEEEIVPGDAPVAINVDPDDMKRGFGAWILSHKLACTCIIFVIMGIVIGVTVGVVLSEKSPDYELILSEQSARFQEGSEIVLDVTPIEVLLDQSVVTPQFLALTWLADEDEAELDFNSDGAAPFVLQRYALATLYYAAGGEVWTDQFNFLSVENECDWKGISEDGRDVGVASCNDELFVTSLQMPENNLTGTIPGELGSSLPFLELLTLTTNPLLEGTIPNSISELQNLTEVRLFENGLTGPIPVDIGKATALTYIAFQNNELGDEIPTSIGDLSLLENFFATANKLSGPLPSEMGLLSNLRILHLSTNRLNGSIPSEMSGMTSLRQVELQFTDLSDGGDNLCGIDSLVVYSADCYEQLVPAIAPEMECSCCSLCCSEFFDGCIGNGDN